MTAKDNNRPRRRRAGSDSLLGVPLTDNVAEDLAAINHILLEMHRDTMIGLGLGGSSASTSSPTIPINIFDTDSSDADYDDDDEDDDTDTLALGLMDGETEMEMQRRLLANVARLRREVLGSFMPNCPDDLFSLDLPMSMLSLPSSPPEMIPSATNVMGDARDVGPRRQRSTTDGLRPGRIPSQDAPPTSPLPPLPPRNRIRVTSAVVNRPATTALAHEAEAAAEADADEEDA